MHRVGVLFLNAEILTTYSHTESLSPNSSADSLEEIVGLDIVYHGGEFRKHRRGSFGSDEGEMDEYLRKYERRKEKAYCKKNDEMADSHGRSVPANSIHQESLHGNGCHGRRTIAPNMIESLDTTINAAIRDNNSSDIANIVDSGSGSGSEERVARST